MKLAAIVEKVLGLSKAEDCIVVGFEYSTVNLRWANNSITTNGVANSHELYVISIIEGRVGVVGQSYFPEDKLEELVRRSEAVALQQERAEDYAELLVGKGKPDNWDAPIAATGIERFSELIPDLGKVFKQASKDGIKLFGFAEHTSTNLYLATTKGVWRRYDQMQGNIAINAKSPDFERSSWNGQGTLDFDNVDVAVMYEKLITRLDWSKTRIDLPAGLYETILEPAAVADLMLYQYWTATARDADEGRTVFSKPGGGNKAGQRLFPKGVTIYSDPAEPGFETTDFEVCVGSNSYQSLFDNGLELTKTEWIKDGVLRNLITPRYWAAKTKSNPNPFIGNLVFESDSSTELDDLIASTKRGLLVNCLWYIREVDPQQLLLTGLTRDGVFLIEDGQIKGAVNNFRFNMSPVQVLVNTTEMTKSVPTLPREHGDDFTLTKMPALRVVDFNMSSVSEAK